MAVVKHDADFDLTGSKLIRAQHNPVTSDPGSPVDGEIWYRTDTDKYHGRKNGVTHEFAMMADVTAGGVSASLWDAESVVVAITDNTPVAQVLAASTVLGRRSTGSVTAVSYANLKTDLALNNVPNTDATARANHTGTQTASTISDFNAAADARVALVVAAAPTALDTLNELAAALGNDANFAATVTTALGTKSKGFAANVGNGTVTQTVTHGLGTTDVTVEVFVIATGETERCTVTRTDANNVKLDWNSTPASNTRRLVVVAKF
jgi:hypothetical protein